DVRIAGGILLVIISVQHILKSDKSIAAGDKERQSPEEIGCVPLACPLLAGPGAMVTSLTIWHGSKEGPMAALTAIVLVLGLFWVLMRFVDTINRVIGKLIITAISKVMLVLVAAIGVNMIMQGILRYFT
ncbi:MAG: MarC family protein, partial [Planctomycetota bacterium]